MAQNFVSYNPMQVGQANAGVIAPSNNKMGQIAFEGAKLGVKQEAERRKAELANKPDYAKVDVNYDVDNGFLNDAFSNLIGLGRADFSKNASSTTKENWTAVTNQAKADTEKTKLLAKGTASITNNANNLAKEAIASGNYINMMRLNDLNSHAQKANKTLAGVKDKNELMLGIASTNERLNNMLNGVVGNNVAQDWQSKLPTHIPPADTNGELTQTVKQDPDNPNMLIYTTIGGKDVRVPTDRWDNAKSNAKLDGSIRWGVLNQYFKNLDGKGIDLRNPASIGNAYLQDMQSLGYGNDVITKQTEQIQGIIDNGGSPIDVANFLYDPKKSPLVDGIIDKQFDAQYNYKKEDIDKTSKSNTGGGSGSDNKSPEVIPFKVSSKSANGDRVTYNADAVNVANSKIPLASGTAVSASDGSLKKTDPNKEYIAQGVSVTPVYKLSNNKVAPIIPSGNNNQSIHDAMKLYPTDDKYGSLTFKVNGKEYTLKDLLISGNISIQPTLIIAESIRRGNTSGDDGLANTTDTGETLLRFITNNEARTYAKSRKTGEANYNNIYKTNNDSFNKAMIRARSNAQKVKAVNKPAPVIDSTKLKGFE